MKRVRIFYWGLASLVLGLCCYGLVYYQLNNQAISGKQIGWGSGDMQIGGDFTLTDQNNRLFSTSEYQGKYRFVYFGYSFCPDICPTGLQNMTGALNILGRDLDEIVPVFVTVDPERDTPDALKSYAGHFHPSFRMLTGSLSEISDVLKKYKVYAVKAKPDGTMADYLMDHSTLIYLMDRENRFIKSFPHTTPPQEMAESLIYIFAQEKKLPTRLR